MKIPTSINKLNSLDLLLVLVLLLPMLYAAVMPSTLEYATSFYFGELRLGWFDFLATFFAIPLFLAKSSKISSSLFFVGVALVFFSISSGLFERGSIPQVMSGLFVAITFFVAAKIEWRFPACRVVILFCVLFLVFISLQLTILSFGLVSVATPSGETIGSAGSISRINTTIGASTGSGAFIIMIGIIGLFLTDRLYGNGKIFYLIMFLTSISTVATFSRGAVLSLLVFLLIMGAAHLKKMRLSHIFVTGLLAGSALYIIFSFDGVYDALFYRSGSSGYTSGRIEMFSEALAVFLDNPIFGVGFNLAWMRDYWLGGSDLAYILAPHNTYLLILAELGLIGFISLFLAFLLLLIKSMNFNSIILFSGLISVFAVGFNTETVYLNGPYIYAFAILMSLTNIAYSKRAMLNSRFETNATPS